ncbi:hypothetical protein L228DRAFT_243175 [Xylona heveae TC161]|uniref:PH domain protein n=1 Tax=Xylona heveae (strain CBS 132557 / TC161) TaxID=1328760 RepID=A0A165JV88_XYLHT|nr:hypothetical protein L228DRAFT_243175 [Xylona heveae TC161]KZF26675.1 hypothetical protein L228DRAFT_243175 [Xylona heveae TC161]
MSGAVANYAAKSFLKRRIEDQAAEQKDSEFHGVRKFKKNHLPYTSDKDLKVLNKVARRARRLDYGLCNCCGLRIGWSVIIGIIPFVGDGLEVLLAMWVLSTASTIEGGIPPMLRSRMYFNIMVDFFVGLVPFVGDVADAFYRCNTRNAKLLYAYLKVEGEKKASLGIQPEKPPAKSWKTGIFARSEKEGRQLKPAHVNPNPRPNPTYSHHDDDDVELGITSRP